jgi:hypothetical protein
VDHLPFIASIRSKLQKWRTLILQLAKKLERVPGGCRPRIDILSLKPTIPLPQNQIFPFGLSHWLRVPSHKGNALDGWIHRAGFSRMRSLFETIGCAIQKAIGYRRAGEHLSKQMVLETT